MDDQIVGRVLRLHRYPLKSADGERLDAVDVTTAGLVDDRRWALARPDGSPVTAKEAPELRGVRARSVAGALEVDPAVSDVVPFEVQVRDAPGQNQQVAAVHLVSEGAASAADAPGGCDPEPRANVVVALDHAGRERSWVGRDLLLGDVRLRVTRTPSSCLGVYAQVLTPGTLRVGDEVRVTGG